jgi:hypothetical protein
MPSFERHKRHSSRHKDKVKISISYPSTEHIASPTMSTTSSNQASMVSSSCSKEPIALRHSSSVDCQNLFKESTSRAGENNSPNSSHKKASKRTSSGVKVQVRKFRMETKAAKTLAIIVGKSLTPKQLPPQASFTSWSDGFCPLKYSVRSPGSLAESIRINSIF